MTPFKAMQPLKSDSLNLVKPFSSNDHRVLAKEVERLIEKRREMGSRMTESMEHFDQSKDVQLQQEQLLQIKVLVDREELFELDPSDARARDVEVLKSVLSKLLNEDQTPNSGRKHRPSGGGDGGASSADWNFEIGGPGSDNNAYHTALEKDLSIDGTKTKKRKRAHETTPAFKKTKNRQIGNNTLLSTSGVPTVVDGQPCHGNITVNVEKSAKKSKTKHRVIHVSSSEVKSREEGCDQNTGGCLKVSKASKDHDGIVKGEINYDYYDKAKKNKRSSKSPKSKSSFIVETEHEVKDDNSKKPTGQVSEAKKHNSGPVDNVKKETMAKKEAKNKKNKGGKNMGKKNQKKQRTATAAIGSDDGVSDVDEQAGLWESETRPGGGHSNLEIETTGDIFVNMKQESPELRKPVQFTDGEQSAANEENNKAWRRNRATAVETNSRVSHSGQDKAQKADIYGSEAAFSTANRAMKGSTRMKPPVIPVPSFSETAGRTSLNPWSAHRRAFSIQNSESIHTPIESTEKTTRPQDGQVWVLGTTGSRKKGGPEDSDTKIVTMTIGKVDAPTKVDQGSPTPRSKTEQKKKARVGRKVKKPAMPLGSRSAIAQGKTSVPSVRVSEDLVRLITPYAALLGSVERAESLNKLLAKDQELLKEEKKAWFKTVGLPYDD
ncbi:hypothetical protein LY78DRAFT_712242 [Colletotrichum sublineola]|nr:hypothetical protein LY78DRAFT_712242 [Colletotrichum sublineola]